MLLIVYGATAGVSVVKLYAGAFFPGIMLAALYVGYVIVVAKLEAAAWRRRCPRKTGIVPLPQYAETIASDLRRQCRCAGLVAALKGNLNLDVPSAHAG